MELRLIKEKPLEVPKINISAETPVEAPGVVTAPAKTSAPVESPTVVAASAKVAAPAKASTPVKVAAPAPVQAPAQAPAIIAQEKNPAEEPPKPNNRESHILLYPCQKCGEPTAFCYLRTVEFEKKESQRYCLVCFEKHEKAKNQPNNVSSALTSGSTFKKRVTWEAWKLIGILTASIIALAVGLFFAIRNHSKGKQPQSATIAGATDASGQPAKPGDKPVATANGQPANSVTHPGSKKPGDPNAAAKPGAIATNGNISDANAKTAATPGTTGSKTATTSETKKAAEADAKKSAEHIEKIAALAEKENSGKLAKDKDKDKDPNTLTSPKDAAATDSHAAKKPGEKDGPKKPGEKETAKDAAKPGEKDPAKTASATDTIKQIENLIPMDEKKAAPKSETAESEKKTTAATQDDKPKDLATTGGPVAADNKENNSKPNNAKPTISHEKAVELNGKLSTVAAKVAPKLKSASTIASRITEVATRFAPKTDLASGPLERTAARQNDTSEQGDLNLDGGTGEDAWDALQREIAESDPSVKLTNNSTSTDGAPGTNTPNSPYTIPGLQPKIPGKTPGTPSPSNALNIKPNTPASASPAKKVTQLKSTDIVLNDLSGKPRKTASLNGTEIQINSLNDASPKKQTQLNSTEIKLNATEIMLSPFTEIPTRKAQLNNTEIVLNTLTGVASEQAKLNSTTILLRPLVEPKGVADITALKTPQAPTLYIPANTPPVPKIIVNRYVAIPDAFKGEVIIHTLNADTLFADSPTSLCKAAEDHLAPFAEGIIKHTEIPILIRCYTDNIGTLKENLALSQKRAETVRNWFVKKTGVPAKNFTIIGMGSSEPIASNTYSDGTDNFQGRARNRRITITTPTLMPSKTPGPPAATPVTATIPVPVPATAPVAAPTLASIPTATQVAEATPAPAPAITPPTTTAAISTVANIPGLTPTPVPTPADTPTANKTATPSEAHLPAATSAPIPVEKQPAQ